MSELPLSLFAGLSLSTLAGFFGGFRFGFFTSSVAGFSLVFASGTAGFSAFVFFAAAFEL